MPLLRERRTIQAQFTINGVFYLTVFSDFDRYKFYVCEASFRAESIGASPVIIAYNSGKLCAFFYQASQRKRIDTIGYISSTKLTHKIENSNKAREKVRHHTADTLKLCSP